MNSKNKIYKYFKIEFEGEIKLISATNISIAQILAQEQRIRKDKSFDILSSVEISISDLQKLLDDRIDIYKIIDELPYEENYFIFEGDEYKGMSKITVFKEYAFDSYKKEKLAISNYSNRHLRAIAAKDINLEENEYYLKLLKDNL